MKPGVVATALVLVAGAGAAGALFVRDQGKLETATKSLADGERHLSSGNASGARKAFDAAKVVAGEVTSLTFQNDAAAKVAARARSGLRTATALETASTDPLGALRVVGSLDPPLEGTEDVLGSARAALLVDAALALEAREAVDQAKTVYAQARAAAKATNSPRLAEAALGERRLTVLASLRDATLALERKDEAEAGRHAKTAKAALEHSESPFRDAERVKKLATRVDVILAEVESHAALSGYARTVEDLYQRVDTDDLGTLYPVVKNLEAPTLAGKHPRAAAHAARLTALKRQQARILTVASAFRGMVRSRQTGGVTVFLEKTEVTNADYVRFVAAGGYTKEEFWGSGGRTRLPNFVDRTGKPGPKYWSRGNPPKGREKYPVRGISFFEAEAYAKWRKRRLPTLADWTAAAAKSGDRYPWGNAWRDGLANVHPPGSKRGASVAVGKFPKGASPSGALDMVGNVRELVRLGGGKYAGMGGSFNEKPERATVQSKRNISPTIRASDTGFRCAKELKWDR